MILLLKIVASLALLIGAVWILQGLNILPGSFMTGRMEWAWRGAALAIAGAAIWAFVLRRR
jgi:hypothetical protein